MVIDVFGQCIDAMIGPSRRDVLLARISPRVAVVEVNHDAHSFSFRPFTHLYDFLFAAGTTVDRPHPKSDAIDALFFKNLQNILLSAVLIQP